MAPEQKDLPTMENREIEELEDAAQAYKKAQKKRMAILDQEVDLKQTILRLLKKHGKTEYHRDGIDIELVTEQETVKVHIREEKPKEKAEK